MSSVNTAVQLITREQAEKGLLPRPGPRAARRWPGAPGTTTSPNPSPGSPPTAPVPPATTSPRQATPRQGQLPEEYKKATDAELDARIRAAKATLGDRAVILGHFYQRDEVIEYADFVGDSFQLANAALTKPDAEAIIFCGVHFMAETADILSTPDQAVILPNLAAGCSMADMADIDSVTECWEQLEEIFGTEPDADGRVPVIPVTYMNSSAALKGFCGEHGGIVCTSSNAASRAGMGLRTRAAGPVLPRPAPGPQHRQGTWASRWSRCPCGTRARTSAATTNRRCRTPASSCGTASARCTSASTSARSRRPAPDFPGVNVIVHPECPMEVVDAADSAGSTDFIKKAIAAATEPTTFAIGTEINMVNRLAAEYPQHTIFCLDPVICPCSTMYRIHPGYLAWVLEALVGRAKSLNRITVDDDVAGHRPGSRWNACWRQAGQVTSAPGKITVRAQTPD